MTSKRALAEAMNGDVITGDPSDVATLENNVEPNFQSAEKRIQSKMELLARAFLLNSSVQREGERVTAEEIRYMAQELQDALGGVYSGQVTTFQRPYSILKMAALQRTGRMTILPKQAIKVAITTGAAALSRNAESQALDALANPRARPPRKPQRASSSGPCGLPRRQPPIRSTRTVLSRPKRSLTRSNSRRPNKNS